MKKLKHTEESLVVAADRSMTTAKAVGLLLGMAAALVSVRSPIFPSYINFAAILIVLALAVAVLGTAEGSVRSLRITIVDVLLFSLLVVRAIAEYINSTYLGMPFSSTTLLDSVLAFAALLSARLAVNGPEHAVVLLKNLVLPATAVAIIAIAQIAGVPGVNDFLVAHVNSGGLANRIDGGWAIRATSTIGHWTALGGYLCVAIAVRCLLLSKSSKVRIWDLLALLVLMIGQLATLTFATIGLSVAIFISLLLVRRASILQVGALIVGGFLVWALSGSLLSERVEKQAQGSESLGGHLAWLPESVGFRVNVWITETIPAISERPLFGWGISAYRYLGTGRVPAYMNWISPESEWMRTAVSSGLVALAVQVLLIIAVWRLIVRCERVLPGRTMLPLLTLFLGLVFISSIHSHFSNRGVPYILWPIVGVLLAVSYSGRRYRQERSVDNFRNATSDSGNRVDVDG